MSILEKDGAPLWEHFGRVWALDRELRILLEPYHLNMPLDDVRIALVRTPDFEDERCVSWGNITRDDLRIFGEVEEEENDLSSVLKYAQELSPSFAISLTYSNHYWPNDEF